jgi:hypothetical protein
VISKYSPLASASQSQSYSVSPANSACALPFVDHSFYTTINVVRTIEALLGVPPMNANDARAAVMAPLFSGSGQQPAFSADYRNRDSGFIYEINTKEWKEGKNLDFRHADAVDTALLNKFLWQERKGDAPMPPPQHNVFPASHSGSSSKKDPD